MDFSELRSLVARDLQEDFESRIPPPEGPIMFERPGLRICSTDTGFRVHEAAWYDGPPAVDYVQALQERAIESALVDEYLKLTPADRRARLAQNDRVAAALSRPDRADMLVVSAHDYRIETPAAPTRPAETSRRTTPTSRGLR